MIPTMQSFIKSANVSKIVSRAAHTMKEPSKIIVHHPPRGKFAPSLSPFVIKLETYLRMVGLPYKSDMKNPFGKKGKTPWMTIDGTDVADTHFCIDYLRKNYGVDLNEHLTAEEKAIAVAFKTLVEDHLLWAGLTWRVNKEDLTVMKTHVQTNFIFSNVFVPLFKRRMRKALHAQGMGRHNWDEIRQLMEEDVNALTTFLGNKKYMMGDKPSEVDCSVFGMLCQLKYNSVEKNALEEWFESAPGKSMQAYISRIKEDFWPDWDQCVYPRPKAKM